MPPRQTISFFNNLSKQVISIQVSGSAYLPQGAGYFQPVVGVLTAPPPVGSLCPQP